MNNITIFEDGSYKEEYTESSLIKVESCSNKKGFAFNKDPNGLVFYTSDNSLLNELKKYMMTIKDKNLKYKSFEPSDMILPSSLEWINCKNGTLSYSRYSYTKEYIKSNI